MIFLIWFLGFVIAFTIVGFVEQRKHGRVYWDDDTLIGFLCALFWPVVWIILLPALGEWIGKTQQEYARAKAAKAKQG